MRAAGLIPSTPPDHLANSGWQNWDEFGNRAPPIFGMESRATSLPIYLPITQIVTEEPRNGAEKPGWFAHHRCRHGMPATAVAGTSRFGQSTKRSTPRAGSNGGRRHGDPGQVTGLQGRDGRSHWSTVSSRSRSRRRLFVTSIPRKRHRAPWPPPENGGRMRVSLPSATQRGPPRFAGAAKK